MTNTEQLFGGFHYTIDVALATHDDLRAGNVATKVTRIFLQLAAVDDVAAVHIACSLAHDRAGGDFMPTGADLIDFPF